jgi:hypothetical protein
LFDGKWSICWDFRRRYLRAEFWARRGATTDEDIALGTSPMTGMVKI